MSNVRIKGAPRATDTVSRQGTRTVLAALTLLHFSSVVCAGEVASTSPMRDVQLQPAESDAGSQDRRHRQAGAATILSDEARWARATLMRFANDGVCRCQSRCNSPSWTFSLGCSGGQVPALLHLALELKQWRTASCGARAVRR